LSKERILSEVSEYYDDKLKVHGATPRGVDWNSSESQELRFVQLMKVIRNWTGDNTILDYGCGLGDLLKFIESVQSLNGCQYTGFDISKEMISQAANIHRNSLALWVSEDTELNKYDYTVASGIFNVKQKVETEVWENYILDTLNHMNELTINGFSFNMLTSYSDTEYMKDYLYYADPMYYFDFCKRNFSKNVALLHDYDLFEFTILIMK